MGADRRLGLVKESGSWRRTKNLRDWGFEDCRTILRKGCGWMILGHYVTKN